MENLIKVLESTKEVRRQTRVYLILREVFIICDGIGDDRLSCIYAVISQKKYNVTMSISYFYSLVKFENRYLPASPKAVSMYSFETAVAANAAYNNNQSIDDVVIDIKYDILNMIRLKYSIGNLIDAINRFSPVKIAINDIHRHLETKLSKEQVIIICNITCSRLVATTPFQNLFLLKIPAIVRHHREKYSRYGTSISKKAPRRFPAVTNCKIPRAVINRQPDLKSVRSKYFGGVAAVSR